jgi:hypothetical protein
MTGRNLFLDLSAVWMEQIHFQVSRSIAEYTKAKFLQDPEKKTPVLQQTAVLGSPCSNTLPIAAAEAIIRSVGNGIFKAPQWIKSFNDRK